MMKHILILPFIFNILSASAHSEKERDQAALRWAKEQRDTPLRQISWDELNGEWNILKDSSFSRTATVCKDTGGTMKLYWFSGGETPHSQYFGTQVSHNRYCKYDMREIGMGRPVRGGSHDNYVYDQNGPGVLKPTSLLSLNTTWKIVGYRADQGWLVLRASFGREIVLRRD